MSVYDDVAACDRAILEALNRRIELEAARPPAAQVDLPALAADNDGPLSEAGLRELFSVVLALTRREAARARVAWQQRAQQATL